MGLNVCKSSLYFYLLKTIIQLFFPENESKGTRLTRRLKPVTAQKEMAMAVLERKSSPRCPTIINEMTCRKYWDKFTATMGPAMQLSFFTSSTYSPTPILFLPFPGLEIASLLSSSPSLSNKPLSIFSLCKFLSLHKSFGRKFMKYYVI